MGWLRDLMAASSPPIPSYGDLARRCLEHQDWPRDIQPQARSLASLFSKFDRGMEVEWLAERREVQHVLAQTLTLPLRTVEQDVLKHLGQADRSLNRFRFHDAPNARPIDLREEELPRIFDERLMRPGLWDKLWWVASPGSGQELIAKWLHARALADFATCEAWQEIVTLSKAGTSPLFIDYLGPTPSLDGVSELGERKLCLASASPSPEGFLVVAPLDVRVAEKPLQLWLEPLWVEAADVSSEQVSAWLERLRAIGLGTTFESMLGLISLAYEIGLEKVQALSPIDLVGVFLTKAIHQTGFKNSSEGTWLRDNAHEVLRGMARNALATHATPWNTPQAQADWLALIPSEYQRGVDAEWTRVSLQQAGAPLTVSELEKALKAVPPGGFRVIESLRAASILRDGNNSKLTIKPRWLADYFESAGYAALLEESADSWGTVALEPSRTSGVVNALNREYAASQFRALDAALELDDDSSAGYALAIELLISTTGRLVLLGKELEPEQLGGLLRLQQAQLVQRELHVDGYEPASLPSARLLTAPGDLPAWGKWLLSLWALCEHGTDIPEFGTVNPWASEPALDERMLNIVTQGMETCEPEVVAGAYAMFGRLLQYLERLSSESTQVRALLKLCAGHPLFSVARVLRGDGWDAWELVLRTPLGLHSVRTLVASDQWPYIAKTAWRTWNEKGSPALGLTLFATPDRRALFWPYLQDRVLRALLDERNAIVRQVPSECMKAEWVTMYLERVPEQSELAKQYLEVIPMTAITDEHFEVLFELLEAHAFTERVMGLWESHARAAYQRLLSLLDSGKHNQARVWLTTLPESQLAELVDHLKTQVERVGTRYPSFELCRSWLHDLCCHRKPGWLRTYDLFSDMELRLKRVARAAPITITPADSP